MLTRKISEITILEETYQDCIYLTVDFDWAHDELLGDTLNLLEGQNIKCTFFVTHDTPILSRIRSNPNFELGIHPNLNPLLHEINEGKRLAKNCFEELLSIVPEAQSFRCHSMTNSSRILELAASLGLKFDCNYFIPYQANIELRPWITWNGITRVPYFWEDDISLEYGVNETPSELQQILQRSGLKVFDFHPIHIGLNSEHLNRYEKSRENHHRPKALKASINPGYGTRDKFQFILQNTSVH